MSDSGIDRSQWKRVIDVLEEMLPYYEKLNNLNTLGRLSKWRRAASSLANENDIVLEIGPGSGGFAKTLDCGKLYCLDPSVEILLYAREQLNGREVNLVSGIAEDIPFGDDTFDIVFCIFSFRDFMSREGGLREIRRVLRPGGRLCVVDVSLPKDGVLRRLVNLHIYHIAPRLSSLAFPREMRREWVKELYPSFLGTLESFGEASQYPNLCRKVGFSDVDIRFLSGRSAFIITGVK